MRRRGRALAGAVLAALLLVLNATGRADAATGILYIRGAGDGHGIGMSQYGAYGYALHGADYRMILAHYYRGTALGTTDPARTVRVLLGTQRSASFRGATGVVGSGTGGAATAVSAGDTYTVTAAAGGRLAVSTRSGGKVGTFTPPLIAAGPAPLQLAGHGLYRGSLVFSAIGDEVQAVDALGLDDYVRGVVASEMPSTWAPAALEAQAVAARTYAITTTVGGDGYDLYDDTRSQMYGGIDAETAATDAAVAATAGQIVTYAGRPAVTYFFASSGGYTESIQNVWPGATPEPWLQGVPDPYDGAAGDPYHLWHVAMSLSAAARRLGGLVNGRLLAITVIRHGVSPRIVAAQIIGSRGRTSVTGAQLQSAFGLLTTFATFTTKSVSATPAEHHGKIGLIRPR